MLANANSLTKQLLLSRSVTKIAWVSVCSPSQFNPTVLNQRNQHQKHICVSSASKFHTSSFLRQGDDKTPKKTSILGTPVVDANKSVLTDDLVKNFTGVEKQDAQTGKQDNAKQSADQTKSAGGQSESTENKSGWSKWFSREHGWKLSLGLVVIMAGSSLVYCLTTFGPEKLDENNNPIKDEFSDKPMVIQYPLRTFYSIISFYDMMKKPSTDKLLPEPIQLPYYQPPYTLVIEMTGVMLHPEWTFSTGWRYKKRPGLDYFLEQIKYPLFEVVLFTKEPFIAGAPIVASLDPQQLIQFKLFRESTQFISNHYVKDLSYMNRDLKKIIVIDWDENAYQLQPRNALHRLKKWDGDENDTDLVYLASFLKLIASSGVDDVRSVLDYYNNEVDPLETFKLKQVQIKEAEIQRQEEIKALKEKQASKFSLFRR